MFQHDQASEIIPLTAAVQNAQAKPQLVPIEYLEANPYQVRQIDISRLGDLIHSIEKYGFVGHLEARINPNDQAGKRQLVYGHRRMRAAELAGLRTIPVKTVERTDAEMREFAYIENGTVEPLTYWEEGLHFKQLQDAGMSMNEIAETIGKSKGYVQGRLDVLRLEEDVLREAAQSGQFEITFFTTLLTMPAEERLLLFEDAKAGKYTPTDLRRIRAEMNKSIAERKDVLLAEPGEIRFAPADTIITTRFSHDEPFELDQDQDMPGPDPDKIIDMAMRVRPAHDRSVISPLSGRDWALRVLNQMRGVRDILELNCRKADFTTLSEDESTELVALRDEVVDMLSAPELILV